MECVVRTPNSTARENERERREIRGSGGKERREIV